MLTKPKRIEDKKYILWIKSLGCIICGRDSTAHHEAKAGNGGKGTKCSDLETIPLCNDHHNERHNTGRLTFATKYGIDYELLKERLRGIYGTGI